MSNGINMFRILTELGITLDKVREEAVRLIVCPNLQEKRNTK